MEAQEDFSQSPFFKDLDFNDLPPLPPLAYDIPRPADLPPSNPEIVKLIEEFRRSMNQFVDELFDEVLNSY